MVNFLLVWIIRKTFLKSLSGLLLLNENERFLSIDGIIAYIQINRDLQWVGALMEISFGAFC